MIEQEITREAFSQPFNVSAEWILTRRPALETVVRPFATVLGRRAEIIAALNGRLPATLLQRPINESGMSWLVHHLSGQWDDWLAKAIGDLLPALTTSFPDLNADFQTIDEMLSQHPGMAGTLSRAWLDGNQAAFNALAEDGRISAGALGFVVHWAISTLFNALRIKWQEAETPIPAIAGHCPFCGSLPAMVLLLAPDQRINAFLSGGGGQAHLYCGLCGHQWRFARNRCPMCKTDDHHHLVYYQESEDTGQRINACHHCGHYLLCLDLRQTQAPPSLEMAAVGMIHLDVLAREKGFRPMAWTPWNRID